MARGRGAARLRALAFAGLLAAGTAVGTVGAAAGATGTGDTTILFGSRATAHQGLKPFPRWTGAIERYFEARKDRAGSCDDPTFNRCHYERWQALIRDVAGKPRLRQLEAVNDFMNRYRYILDPINWGVKDYWASPDEFFRRFGDCEDYAIAKYFSLRAIGVPADDLRIVVLQDLNLGIPHAVLTVREGDKIYVLDNQISMVVEAGRIRHYRPIYSVNENGWWRYRPAG
ncbi:transglutaminase-like cysteine peptidase [Oceanibacterium hippocampi]|nr:transglutaminase-like cysteine peptidase [Oceanibacterium hippocampi]